MGIEESVQRIENDGMGVGNRVAMGDGGRVIGNQGKEMREQARRGGGVRLKKAKMKKNFTSFSPTHSFPLHCLIFRPSLYMYSSLFCLTVLIRFYSLIFLHRHTSFVPKKYFSSVIMGLCFCILVLHGRQVRDKLSKIPHVFTFFID